MSFNTKLIDLLKTNQSLVDDEGELLTAAVQDKAWKIDHDLIKLLLSDLEVKQAFFEEIEGHWVFNINKFIEYITQKNFLDNSYTRFRNKIGLTIDGKYLSERGEVALAWPYKDCVLEGGQTKEEEKRKEIFFNEILAQDEINRLLDPKVLTNFVRYTPGGKEKVTEFRRNEDGVISENLIIKGNNLLALHTLKEQFRGQVKLIYIDPPFNTGGSSFSYNDSFNHSTWLTFMKNRLEISRLLLSNKGAIFIHIDYIEMAYLKVLCDEIFGRENFVQTISVKTATPAGFKVVNPGPVNVTEFILMYTKNKREYDFKHGFVEASYQKDYNIVIENINESSDNWKLTKLKDLAIKELGFASYEDVREKYGTKVAMSIINETMAELAEKNADRVFASYAPHNPSGNLRNLIEESKQNPLKIYVQKREGKNDFIMQNGRLFAMYKDKLKLINGKLVPTQLLTDFWSDLSWDSPFF